MRRPLVILDGVKNALGARSLARFLGAEVASSPKVLLYLPRDDKDAAGVLRLLLPSVGAVVLCEWGKRAYPHLDELATMCATSGVPVHATASLTAGFDAGLREAGLAGALIVAGSLKGVTAARRVLLESGRIHASAS